jgi:hypothetical protein
MTEPSASKTLMTRDILLFRGQSVRLTTQVAGAEFPSADSVWAPAAK